MQAELLLVTRLRIKKINIKERTRVKSPSHITEGGRSGDTPIQEKREKGETSEKREKERDRGPEGEAPSPTLGN